jgi:diguanylate cyclase (GGDEF)-like protein
MPALYAAIDFSFSPPMGSTLPLRVISPVIATSLRTFLPVSADTREVATFKDFLNNLPKHLLRASIDAISICVYDEPLIHKKTDDFFMPNKARRIFKYEKIYKDSLNYDEVYFNPHEQLIPKNTFFKNYPKLVVIPLFEKEYQYGYFVASIESDNYLFYEILCEFFAKEITHALKIDDFYMKNKELQTTAEHLSYLSQTDELTQIMNRRGFVKNVSQIFNEKKSGMIIYCDMDGLKKINDTFGHDGGDKAIIAQSKILLNSCSDTDIVARFAGDEFVVASLNMTQKGFEKFKKSVAKQCEFFNSSSGFDYKISISMGAAAFGPANYDLPIILAQADIELYKDKRSKKKEK